MKTLAQSQQVMLDDLDWKLLIELQEDARLSYAELGRRVGLSSPAVQERVRKLEDHGIIKGYRTEIDLARAGLGISAFIRIGNMGGLDEERLERAVHNMPEALECHHITGADCYLIRVVAKDIPHLERVVGKFIQFTHTTTSVVLSSPIEHRIISPENYE